MAGVAIEVVDTPINQFLARLAAHIDDLSPLFADWGEYLIGSTQDRMARELSPDGQPWAPLSPAYAATKPEDLPILRLTGAMADTLAYNAGPKDFEFGTGRIYGAAQHFGRPEIHLPARPWLGLTEEDVTELLLQTRDYVADTL